jgi:hypothetical protein
VLGVRDDSAAYAEALNFSDGRGRAACLAVHNRTVDVSVGGYSLTILGEALQFPGFGPMHDLKTKVNALIRCLKVADLAKHEIVLALNPINLPSPRPFFPSRLEMNPDATHGNVHNRATESRGHGCQRCYDYRGAYFDPRFRPSFFHVHKAAFH